MDKKINKRTNQKKTKMTIEQKINKLIKVYEYQKSRTENNKTSPQEWNDQIICYNNGQIHALKSVLDLLQKNECIDYDCLVKKDIYNIF